MAGKDNASESEIDKTTFFWVGLCGICHPGGGPGEYDRDDVLLFDHRTGELGYEKLGKTAADVRYDGDYSEMNTSTGDLRAAPWSVTGVAEADCMLCHREDRTVSGGKNMNWIWRAATLRAKDKLVDESGTSVPAYAAASTAAQGWFNALELAAVPAGKPPMATKLQIDYGKGLADGSLMKDTQGGLYLSGLKIGGRPKDFACWGCHVTPELKKRGRAWFDPEEDVHYAAFNRLHDADDRNDVPAAESRACTQCHPAGMDHNIAKGNATLGSVHNALDYDNFKTCADCHSRDAAVRDPNAPAVPDNVNHSDDHMRAMSCEACHIPYKTDDADLFVDNATTGSTIGYKTNAFLSADPLDPTAADRSRWYPSFVRKKDRDGRFRLYPVKLLLSAWWGDWDEAAHVIRPIPLWRVRQITKGAPLPGVFDDNGDGKPEVNRLDEIRLYIDALKGDDKYGKQIAARPVLVRGGRVWHEDSAAADGVSSFDYEGSGIHTESSHPFSINHNVRPSRNALGWQGCAECHKSFTGAVATPVFDRKILIDPFGPDGKPVYRTVREITGFDPQ